MSNSPVDLTSSSKEEVSSLESKKSSDPKAKIPQKLSSIKSTKTSSSKESSNNGGGFDTASMFCFFQCQICGFPCLDIVTLQLHTITMHSVCFLFIFLK